MSLARGRLSRTWACLMALFLLFSGPLMAQKKGHGGAAKPKASLLQGLTPEEEKKVQDLLSGLLKCSHFTKIKDVPVDMIKPIIVISGEIEIGAGLEGSIKKPVEFSEPENCGELTSDAIVLFKQSSNVKAVYSADREGKFVAKCIVIVGDSGDIFVFQKPASVEYVEALDGIGARKVLFVFHKTPAGLPVVQNLMIR